ncbi:protein Gawky isoform X3 [Daktulosphaira vitifoliae]|uniref:protein Gawky isoform X3 n=1 Tax=Daktulosphaira vitifoliae TaxID=58002 RepID=UPI0021A99142|nr:protein Gawky isoform X3 [Daktulosphaira vitifoliae]
MVISCASNTNGSNTVQKKKEIKTDRSKSLMDEIVCATTVTLPSNICCDALSLSTGWCNNVIDKADSSATIARNKINGVVVGGGAGSLCHSRQSSFVLHLPTTPLNWSVISSSTFRFTRGPPSHHQTQNLYGTMVTASNVESSTWGRTGRRPNLACYSGAHNKDVTTTINFRVKSNCSTSDNDSDDQSAMYKTIPFKKLYIDDPIAQYKRNWGISTICRLIGGGETTLASGNGTATAGWGNPGTTPVPASVTGTSNWNTSPLVDGQSPPNVSSGPWQQTPQSSSTSSNNTSQTSNIGNKGQSSSSASSSGNSTLSTSQTPTSQQNTTSWAQAAGKNLPASSGPQVSGNSSTTTTTASTNSGIASNPQSTNSPPSNGGNGAVNPSTKQQLEQINTMREALYAQDGWGGQHVNQDSQWEVPHSPEPNTKDGPLTGLTGGPGWSKVNNGTDLWEATLRNGGQPPLQIPVQNTSKTPWGHTPASNIGGTWGEDDDVSSVSGVEGNTGNWGLNTTGSIGNQWGQGQPPQGPGGPMWGGPPKKDIGPDGQSWNSGNNAWNDLNRPPGAIDQGPHRRDIIPNGIVDHSRGIGSDARGGISGRLNGTLSGAGTGMEPMWGGPPPHHLHHVQPPGPPPSVLATPGSKLGQGPPVPVINQWSGPPPPPKDLNPMNNNNKGSGWEEPSPTDHRRNLLNYDDGTSLWGNAQSRPNIPGGLLNNQHNVNKHWSKADMAAAAVAAAGRNNASGNMGNQCPPGVPPNRGGMPPNKMVDQQLWPGNPRNGSWGDVGGGGNGGPHDLNIGGPWVDDKMGLGGTSGGPWPNSEWGPGPKSKNSWGDCANNDMDPSSWGQKNVGQKNQNKDYIWQSKPYRILTEMGVKKEDVEAVSRSYNIGIEEALEFLMSTRGPGNGNLDTWNSHGGRGQHPDDQNPFDRSNINQQRYNSQQLPFAVPSMANNSNQQQAILQKLLAQQPPSQQNSMQQQFSQSGSRQMPNQPTAQQLRMLVQQIQMAVQAGYLNHQILNQPLAPQTLIMLNQLLQQIKILQQNAQIQAAIGNAPKSGPAMVTAAIAMTKARQQIATLQNQIANNQAIHMKAQAHQNQSNFTGLSGLMNNQGGEFFKNDPLTLLQSGFSDISLNKDSQISGQGFQTSQQSRLNQWKMPNLDKDDLGMGSDFSRAPGANSKSTPGNGSPTFNSILNQPDGTWTNVGARSESGWPDNPDDNKEGWPNGANPQSNSSSAFTDLVPEFEPGKPWKGNQMKNIEDDPTITPGSVVRSPLSLAATIKDSNNSDIFNSGGKTSPTSSQSAVDMPLTPLSLSSSTWSFNPTSSTQSSFSSPLGKVNNSKNNWADGNTGNDLWGNVLGSSGKSRGPPPGLSGGINKTSNPPNNGWPRWPSNNGSSWQSSSNNIASTWLLLKNLTPQIDGSTLKTLCIQHGPLLNFHMYLSHGIALAKYSSREEASKAQGALNNCVLGNTTIFAESPTDAEVQMVLAHLSGGSAGNTGGNNSVQQQQQQSNWNNNRNGNNGNSQGQQGSDTWANSQLWGGNNSGPPGTSSSLWGAGGDQIDPHRTTPSSINSFLPGDLLGSETM